MQLMIFLDTKVLTENKNIFQHVESRLRISLPENLSTALADGVILCHVANHVRPRAVPSIHVPSPAVVSNFDKSISIPIDLEDFYMTKLFYSIIILRLFQPKLNTAKCRRNVENFLLACKRIGVREVRK